MMTLIHMSVTCCDREHYRNFGYSAFYVFIILNEADRFVVNKRT